MEDNKNMPPIQQPAPNWNLATNMKCDKCGHDVFVSGAYLQRLSKLVAMTDRDMVRPVPVFACAKCGNVNEEFKLQPSAKKPDA